MSQSGEVVDELLGLPKKDLDEAMKRTVDLIQSRWSTFQEDVHALVTSESLSFRF